MRSIMAGDLDAPLECGGGKSADNQAVAVEKPMDWVRHRLAEEQFKDEAFIFWLFECCMVLERECSMLRERIAEMQEAERVQNAILEAERARSARLEEQCAGHAASGLALRNVLLAGLALHAGKEALVDGPNEYYHVISQDAGVQVSEEGEDEEEDDGCRAFSDGSPSLGATASPCSVEMASHLDGPAPSVILALGGGCLCPESPFTTLSPTSLDPASPTWRRSLSGGFSMPAMSPLPLLTSPADLVSLVPSPVDLTSAVSLGPPMVYDTDCELPGGPDSVLTSWSVSAAASPLLWPGCQDAICTASSESALSSPAASSCSSMPIHMSSSQKIMDSGIVVDLPQSRVVLDIIDSSDDSVETTLPSPLVPHHSFDASRQDLAPEMEAPLQPHPPCCDASTDVNPTCATSDCVANQPAPSCKDSCCSSWKSVRLMSRSGSVPNSPRSRFNLSLAAEPQRLPLLPVHLVPGPRQPAQLAASAASCQSTRPPAGCAPRPRGGSASVVAAQCRTTEEESEHPAAARSSSASGGRQPSEALASAPTAKPARRVVRSLSATSCWPRADADAGLQPAVGPAGAAAVRVGLVRAAPAAVATASPHSTAACAAAAATAAPRLGQAAPTTQGAQSERVAVAVVASATITDSPCRLAASPPSTMTQAAAAPHEQSEIACCSFAEDEEMGVLKDSTATGTGAGWSHDIVGGVHSKRPPRKLVVSPRQPVASPLQSRSSSLSSISTKRVIIEGGVRADVRNAQTQLNSSVTSRKFATVLPTGVGSTAPALLCTYSPPQAVRW